MMEKVKNIRLLMIGPMPPPIAGPRISFRYLVNDLEKRSGIDLRVISQPQHIGRVDYIINVMVIFFKMLINMPLCDVVVLHVSRNSTQTLGLLVWGLAMIFKCKCVLRVFGGSLDGTFKAWPSWKRALSRRSFLKMDLILLETRNLVRYFSQIAYCPVGWYPNNRPAYQLKKSARGTSNGCHKFIFISHVHPKKGVRLILEAAKKIDSDIVIDVYGSLMGGINEDEFYKSRVNYKGIIADGGVISTLRGYDALLFPTYYETEGYPGIIIEAYMAGLPVITTNWPSITEIVDADSGILIKPKDVDSLVDAMKQMMRATPEEMAHWKENALQKADEFSAEQWSNRFAEYIQAVSNGTISRENR